MQKQTIIALNQVNQQFYAAVSAQFSQTRSYAWAGWEVMWEKLSPLLLSYSDTPVILDVGCGNGRFAQFVSEKLLQLNYLGVDQSRKLLELAEQNTLPRISNGTVSFREMDLIGSLTDGNFVDDLNGKIFDLIVLFGVLHHVPSLELRQQLLQELNTLLSPQGVLVVSCWRFDRNESLFSRRIAPETLQLDHIELEEGDYFLTWERGVSATRYCHLTLPAEQDALARSAGLQITGRFSADGKTGMDNDYVLLGKE